MTPGTGSHSSDTHPTTSAGATSTAGWLTSVADFIAEHQPNFIRRRMRRLRIAHVAAAQRAATEQSALRDQVLNRQSEPMAPGLRSMMFDNRIGSPSLGQNGSGLNGNNAGFGGNGQRRRTLAFQTSLTTTDTSETLAGSSSERRDVMPILLEHGGTKNVERAGGSGSNSIRSLSVLPEDGLDSSNGFGNGRRRHSLHNVAQPTSSPGVFDSLLKNDDNEISPKSPDEDDEAQVLVYVQNARFGGFAEEVCYYEQEAKPMIRYNDRFIGSRCIGQM